MLAQLQHKHLQMSESIFLEDKLGIFPVFLEFFFNEAFPFSER